jgi:D-amino-acid oxidase
MPPGVDLPTPDFTFDPTAPGACVAGVRPYRKRSYRLDHEMAGDKFLVHNYGHGGAGITMSWGCAQQVHDLVAGRIATTHDTSAAVLGAGVMGLTAATLLTELGLEVTTYSDRKPVDTTSHKAGGQWAVSVVEYAHEQELKKILTDSYTRFRCELGPQFGVYERPNYTHERTKNFDVVLQLCPGLIPEPVPLTRMPFQGHTRPGYEYRTLLIEPPVFLARLENDLRRRGVIFLERRFDSRADILATVPHDVIVNCTGMGAKNLFNDAEMQPIKGQLAMLPVQTNLGYLYSGDGYLFPRSDHVVIGGTYEENVADEDVSQAVCKNVVKYMAAHFGVVPPMPMPRIHINHPDHAAVYDPVLPSGPAQPSVNV